MAWYQRPQCRRNVQVGSSSGGAAPRSSSARHVDHDLCIGKTPVGVQLHCQEKSPEKMLASHQFCMTCRCRGWDSNPRPLGSSVANDNRKLLIIKNLQCLPNSISACSGHTCGTPHLRHRPRLSAMSGPAPLVPNPLNVRHSLFAPQQECTAPCTFEKIPIAPLTLRSHEPSVRSSIAASS